MKNNGKQKMFLVFGLMFLIGMVGGLTFAFFNYTRIGLSNTLRVGRISFVSSQDGFLNLSNAFPIASSDVENDDVNVKSVSIAITGDTDYVGGVEYLVSFSDVNLKVGKKRLPVTLDVTVDNGNNNSLGTEETGDYYANRENYNASKYKIEYDGKVKEGSHLLIGYIAKNSMSDTIEGINGIINIRAYIDKDYIKISDTYDGSESDEMGTMSSWVEEKTVFTTDEWNSIVETPLSFKIKVEANEGIWVKDPKSITDSSCFDTEVYANYERNPNMVVSDCVDLLTVFWGVAEEGNIIDYGESYQNFCQGTGGIWGTTFQEELDYGWFSSAQITDLLDANLITPSYSIGIVDYDETCGANVVIGNSLNSEVVSYTFNNNTNDSEKDIEGCVNYLNGMEWSVDTSNGETLEAYCNGTGTAWGEYMKDTWFGSADLEAFAEMHIYNIHREEITANVTSINYGAFQNKGLQSVILPEGITYLESYAFRDNDIDDVIIPNTVENELCNSAFDLNVIMKQNNNIIICSCFKTSDLDNNNVSIIDYDDSCSKNVSIPRTIKNKTVTSIGNSAFASNQLTSVVIPDSVTSIENSAFSNNLLTSVVIPDSITSIGYSAFSNNLLTNVIIPDSVVSIDDNAFYNNYLTSITIPDSVTSIGSNAFKNNQITSLSLGDGIVQKYRSDQPGYISPSALDFSNINYIDKKTINTGLFSNTGLKSLTLGNHVTTIEEAAFSNNQISSVTISESVKSIGKNAFYKNQLTSLIIPDNVEIIGEDAFHSNSLTDLTIGSGVTTLIGGAFCNNNITSLSINMATIPDRFREDQCLNLQYLTLGNNVITIGTSAFRGQKITVLAIPDSVKTIGSSAFAGCNLTSLTIPSSVQKIESGAFSNNGLTSLKIEEGLSIIGNTAFASNQLTSITIPDSVTSIGNGAFSYNLLTSVTIGNGITLIGPNAFYKYSGNQNLASITIDKQCSEIKNMSDYAWIGNNKSGTTIYGRDSEVCDAY